MCSKAEFQRNHSIYMSIHPPNIQAADSYSAPCLPTCPSQASVLHPWLLRPSPVDSATCPLGSADTAAAAEGATSPSQPLPSVLSVSHLSPVTSPILCAAAPVCCQKGSPDLVTPLSEPSKDSLGPLEEMTQPALLICQLLTFQLHHLVLIPPLLPPCICLQFPHVPWALSSLSLQAGFALYWNPFRPLPPHLADDQEVFQEKHLPQNQMSVSAEPLGVCPRTPLFRDHKASPSHWSSPQEGRHSPGEIPCTLVLYWCPTRWRYMINIPCYFSPSLINFNFNFKIVVKCI